MNGQTVDAQQPPQLSDAGKWPLLEHALEHGIAYRELEDADHPFLMALYRSTREVELDRTPWSEAQKQAFIAMQFEAQHQHYQAHYPDALWLVIVQNGVSVGRLYLERWQQEHRIIDIALLPQVRSLGIGGAVLQDVMEEAAHLQKHVSIHVEKENPAMKLYRRLGFTKQEDKGIYDLLSWSSGS